MKICYFTLTKDVPTRDAVYLNGFRQNGVEIVECKDNSPSWRKFLVLYKKHHLLKNDYDILFIGYTAHILVPFTRLVSRKKIVFNALGSLYEGKIISRGQKGLFGLKSVYCWLIDFLAFHSASLSLVETNEQKKYLTKKFFLPDKKITRAWTGVEETIFFHNSTIKKLGIFTVSFRGVFMPESGIEYAIEAANILKNKNINFRIIGHGIEADKVKNLIEKYQLANIEWITEKLVAVELAEKIQECHLSLGQLSNHERLQRTIPFKAFESIAMKIPYLTARNPGILELLKENETCFCANPADPEDLAKKIIELKNNPTMTANVAENAYQLYRRELRPEQLARHLLNSLKTPT
ncbi:MAG TPA: glycosyltransferase [Candidatus Paceibacterota bacterium]